MKRLACLAAFAGVTAGGGVALAGESYSTEVVVKSAVTTPSGALETSGRVRSERKICRQGRYVQLVREDAEGREIVDGDITSFAGFAWSLRAKAAEVTEDAQFFVKAPRTIALSFAPGSRFGFREIRCAGSERVEVLLP